VHRDGRVAPSQANPAQVFRLLLPFGGTCLGSARSTKGTLMESDAPKALTRQDLLQALCPSALFTNEEIAEQQVKEWQEGSVKTLHDGFARMRRHPDFKRAAEAGEDGHHERNQATTKRLAQWAEWEHTTLAEILSPELANETRAWVLRQYERGEIDTTDPPPKLVVYEGALNECFKGVFCDATGDAIFRECLNQVIAKDAKALRPVVPCETPAISLTTEEKTILDLLYREYPMTVLQSDFGVGSPNTAIKYTKSLIDKNLIHQPNGPKKGYTLNENGLALFPPKMAE